MNTKRHESIGRLQEVEDVLRDANPAPSTSWSDEDDFRKAALLDQLERGIADRTRWLPAPFPATAAAGAACLVIVGALAIGYLQRDSGAPVAIGEGALSSIDVAGWTPVASTPGQDSPVLADCAATLASEPHADHDEDTPVPPAETLVSESRGTVSSFIVRQGTYVGWCLGSDDSNMFLLLESPSFTLDRPTGTELVAGPNGMHLEEPQYAFAAGRVGGDVVEVVLYDAAREVQATVDHGWWAAWWPIDEDTSSLQLSARLLMADGSTRQIELERPEGGSPSTVG